MKILFLKWQYCSVAGVLPRKESRNWKQVWQKSNQKLKEGSRVPLSVFLLSPPPSPSPSLSLAVRGAGVRLLVYLKLKVSKQQGGVRDISHTTQYWSGTKTPLHQPSQRYFSLVGLCVCLSVSLCAYVCVAWYVSVHLGKCFMCEIRSWPAKDPLTLQFVGHSFPHIYVLWQVSLIYTYCDKCFGESS